MKTSAWLKAFALWMAILMLAILNGLLREKLLIPLLGNVAGLVGSGLTLSVCILGVALAAAPWYGSMTTRHWYAVGLLWLLLTLTFEFGFGLYVQHKPLAELLEAYTFQGGNLWPLVLFTTFISPRLAARIRGIA